MLKPIVGFFESSLRNKILSIMAAYIVAVLPLFAVLFFFFNQSRILFNELPSIRKRLGEVAARLMEWFNQKFNLDPETSSNWISENIVSAVDIPIGLMQESFQ